MSNSGTRVVRSGKPLTTISESIPNTSLTEISSVGFAFMSMLPSAIGAILHFSVCLNSVPVVQHIARKGKGKGEFCIGSGAYHFSLGPQGGSEPNGDSRGYRSMACRLLHGGQAGLWCAVFRDLCETFWHLSACLGQPGRGRRDPARCNVKIWHNAGRYQANGLSPMTWLITIARNAAVDRLRKRRSPPASMEQAEARPDPAPGPEAQVIAASEGERLSACFDELDEGHAQAVRGAYLDGETYADLATRFDVPLNRMRTWLRRSLLKLKECLSR